VAFMRQLSQVHDYFHKHQSAWSRHEFERQLQYLSRPPQ
jgi:hypothetical protein